MEYLLFAAYLVLFAWLVTKVKFFTRTGSQQITIGHYFLVESMAGIFYGWIGLYYGGLAQMQDTWGYHTSSVQEYHCLYKDPGEYFTNLSVILTGMGLPNSFQQRLLLERSERKCIYQDPFRF